MEINEDTVLTQHAIMFGDGEDGYFTQVNRLFADGEDTKIDIEVYGYIGKRETNVSFSVCNKSYDNIVNALKDAGFSFGEDLEKKKLNEYPS